MQGSITIKTKLPPNRAEDTKYPFSISTKKLPGKLVNEFHVLTEIGELGKDFIHREGFLLIQERDVQGDNIFYIHPYGDEEIRTGFDTLGEAVGSLINEIIGESNV